MNCCIVCGENDVLSFRLLCSRYQVFMDVKSIGDGRIAVVLKNAITVEKLMRPKPSITATPAVTPTPAMPTEQPINQHEVKS